MATQHASTPLPRRIFLQASRTDQPEHQVHWFALLGSLTMSWSVPIALGYWAFG